MYDSVKWHEDFLIYLTATPEVLLKRISHRGSLDARRLEWNEEDLAYINRLIEKYEQYFRRYKYDKNLIRIDTTNLTVEQVAKLVYIAIRRKASLANLDSPATPLVQKSLDRWVGPISSREINGS